MFTHLKGQDRTKYQFILVQKKYVKHEWLVRKKKKPEADLGIA